MINLPQDVCQLVEKTLNQSLDNLVVTVHTGNKKGEGYIGEIIFASFKNKETLKEDHLVIKKVFPSDREETTNFLSNCYLNEINFYTNVWPAFEKFRKSFVSTKLLDLVPKCYGTSSVRGSEKVILENFKFQNYEVHPKKVLVSDALYEEIFKLYGQFHAISFAMRHHQPKEYQTLTKPLHNNWLGLTHTDLFKSGVIDSFRVMEKILESKKEDELLTKIQPYVQNGFKIFDKAANYQTAYPVINHGDCWSNNMLVKYNSLKKIEDIKFIDFQMCMSGSPVYDLSYSFYSGASKESLKNWEKYLKIYHNSLDKSLKGYNLKVDDIYPYTELVKEWKNNVQFAFIMSLLMWGAKFIKEDEVRDLDVSDGELDLQHLVETEEYSQGILNLVKHFDENGFLVSS
ncbi:uncharacterized protein LOC114325831 [Diabrotica virgifera virgifera]|uniref:Uncharacterized protein LOC114325831 n=1 Tax=Diabrotica virgifera virgifera TaxID=50390 RepID=A0A6P7F4F5_DIAVI|nr:uncharacterized protein LOC114325831 [Diabrotica virgifera virgifera]